MDSNTQDELKCNAAQVRYFQTGPSFPSSQDEGFKTKPMLPDMTTNVKLVVVKSLFRTDDRPDCFAVHAKHYANAQT
jgi:hypothetical protein